MASGELDPAQSAAVLEHVEGCDSCSRELDFLATMLSELERSPGQVLQASARAIEANKAERAKTRRHRVLTVGALIIALAGVSALWSNWSAPERSASTFVDFALGPPDYVAHSIRSDGPSLADSFQRAMSAYVEASWQRAADDLDAFLDEHPEHGPARFYRAAALEANGSSVAAIAELERVTAEAATALREHALWRLAHLYGRVDDWGRARDALTELARSDGMFARPAREKLEQMERASR